MSTLSMWCPSRSSSSTLRVSRSALASSRTGSTDDHRNDRASPSRRDFGRSVSASNPPSMPWVACRRICLARYPGSPCFASHPTSCSLLRSLTAGPAGGHTASRLARRWRDAKLAVGGPQHGGEGAPVGVARRGRGRAGEVPRALPPDQLPAELRESLLEVAPRPVAVLRSRLREDWPRVELRGALH